MKHIVTTSLLALMFVSGCKINVSGTGEITDLASKTKQSMTLSVYSKNKGNACEVQLTMMDDEGNVLYQLQSNPINERDLKINTLEGDCNPNALVTVVATATDRVVGTEFIERPVMTNPNTPDPMGHSSNGMNRQMVKTLYKKIVTDVSGQIIDRATGAAIKSFVASSEVRYEQANSRY